MKTAGNLVNHVARDAGILRGAGEAGAAQVDGVGDYIFAEEHVFPQAGDLYLEGSCASISSTHKEEEGHNNHKGQKDGQSKQVFELHC